MLSRFQGAFWFVSALVLSSGGCGRIGFETSAQRDTASDAAPETAGGGTPSNGGASTGDAGAGGVSIGGSSAGGATAGGASNGGASAGASAAGGSVAGGTGSGGSASGGVSAGGASASDSGAGGASNAGGACSATSYYADADGDGAGDPSDAVTACTRPAGRVPSGDDCDDTNPFVHPGATEVCDRMDDDCDGAVDETGCPGDGTVDVWNGKPYLLLATGRTWSDARTACTTAGMQMIRIDDQAEQDHAWALAGGKTTWIGGTDAATEGEWLWSDGTKFWTGGYPGSPLPGVYANWKAGMDPQDAPPGEDCATLYVDHQGQWADEQCDARSYPVLCEAVTR